VVSTQAGGTSLTGGSNSDYLCSHSWCWDAGFELCIL